MRREILLGLGVWLIFSNQIASTQTTTAKIIGTVKDSSGGVVPGVEIVARNLETGFTRTLLTDDAGRYDASNLPLGNYTLHVELPGFRSITREGIRLTVGQEVVIDFTLEMGEVSEEVTVFGDAPLLEKTSATVSGLLDERQISELPVNARSIEQLAFLQPGVSYQTASGEAGRQSGAFTIFGAGPRMTVGGTRGNQSSTLLDGVNINGFWNRGPDTASGFQLGMEAIREFNVLVSNFSAEYGRSAGGVVNIVTRSGSNTFHGTFFEYHRNSALDAKNFFDSHDRPIPPFKRNQFGFAVGGPIRKDKTFFFTTFESLRQGLGVTNIAFVPNAAAREGFLPDATGQSNFIGVDDAVRPFLALYPMPNGPEIGGGLATFTASDTQITNDSLFQVRLDHQFSDDVSYFGRYTYDDAERKDPFQPGPAPGIFVLSDHRSQFLALEESRVLSSTLLNVARFGYSRNRLLTDGVFERPELVFSPGRPEGMLSVGGGLQRLGCLPCVPVETIMNSYEYSDHLTYTRGRHSLKIGATITRLLSYSDFGWLFNGQFNFRNLEALMRNQPSSLRGALPGGNSEANWKATIVGLYVQDDFRVRPNLTLNLGYRYEFQTLPVEDVGRISAIQNFPTAEEFSVVKHPWSKNGSLKNFGPRFGFAWDPFGNSKTVLRGGVGVFNEHALQNALAVASPNTPPFAFPFTKIAPRFPDELSGGFTSVDDIESVPPGVSEGINYNGIRRNPYIVQYNLNVQRELTPGTVLTVGYVGSRGYHLWGGRNHNTPLPTILPDGRKFTPAGAPRRNPNFSQVHMFEASVPSWYNSLLVNFQRRFRNGLQVQGNYTFSRAIDDNNVLFISDTGSSAGAWQDSDCRVCDRGLAPTHIKHNLKVNYTYDLPFGANLGGVSKTLLAGWHINGILNIASGRTLNIDIGRFDRANTLRAGNSLETRPNWRQGYTGNPTDEGVSAGCPGLASGARIAAPDRYFDPCAFELQPAGFFGNVGRNVFTGPGLVNFDFSLTKNFSFGENQVLQFRSEIFNIFNRPNFANPRSSVITSADGSINSTAGRITSTTTTSRQIQFGLKFFF